MKMKKVVGVAVSVVLAVSMVAATAFAAETAPASPTSADKDAGKITFEATGSSSEGLNIELKTSPLSAAEEEALKAAGSVQAYLGADTYSEITRILDSNVTISEIKELMVTGYVASMGDVTAYLHFAALPKAGTQVVVTVKVVTANGNVVTLPVVGTVVEQTSTVNGKPVTWRVGWRDHGRHSGWQGNCFCCYRKVISRLHHLRCSLMKKGTPHFWRIGFRKIEERAQRPGRMGGNIIRL